jgi:hypothetical protein
VFTEFQEHGYPFGFLREKLLNKINSGNKYKFGCIANNGEYLWFFYGKVMCKNRREAHKTYNALIKYCNENNIGKPFTYKMS